MNTKPIFGSASDNWQTPRALFDLCDAEVKRNDGAGYGFCLDAAATSGTSMVGPYLGPDQEEERYRDALTAPWGSPGGPLSVAWLNPPYSRIAAFLGRACDESVAGNVETWALIPARTDTRWWWDLVLRADELRFLKGRLKFLLDGAELSSAPFPSAIAIFRPNKTWMSPQVSWWNWRTQLARDEEQEQKAA